MEKEVFAVKDPHGKIFYQSITDDAKVSQLVVVNRFLSPWDELVEAGWRLVKLLISDRGEVVPV